MTIAYLQVSGLFTYLRNIWTSPPAWSPFRPIEPSDGWNQSFWAEMPDDDRLGGHGCMTGPYIP
jgi:hypothetical protein